MGTLASCSFSTVSFKFTLNNPSRRRYQFFEHTKLKKKKKKKKRKIRTNSCVLCAATDFMNKNGYAKSLTRLKCYSSDNNGSSNNSGDDHDESSSKDSSISTATPEVSEERSQSNEVNSDETPSSSSRPPTISPIEPAYNNFQVDLFKQMELFRPEKVDPADAKLIKDRLFGYSTYWVTKEEPFGDFDEGILFLGNIRGKREDVFATLQKKLNEVRGDKYNLFMVEEPNSEGPDPRGGPRVSFGLLRKEVSESGPTTLWQYVTLWQDVIALLLFLLTIRSSVELGIASQINRLPPEVVKYFTDPNAIEPPDVELLYPFVESAMLLAFGVLGVLLFHELGHFLAAFPKKVKLSIPFFIPNITLGSIGAITQFKSILPDRSTKVDVSLAGPFAGAVLSLSMFTVGLLLSANPDVAGDFVLVPSTLFQGSLLLGLISRASLGYAVMHAATVPIHPLVIAGWCGLTTTAFNMLPMGCLDGGRAVQSLGSQQIFTANPKNVQHMLKTHFNNYVKGEVFHRSVFDFLGNGIFNAEGDTWKFQRQVSSHEFNMKSLRHFVKHVVDTEIFDRLIPFLSAAAMNKTVDLQDVLQRFAFDNICRIAFGYDPAYLGQTLPETEFAKAFEEAVVISSMRFRSFFKSTWKIKRFFGLGSEERLKKSVDQVRDFTKKKIVREKKLELTEKSNLQSVEGE